MRGEWRNTRGDKGTGGPSLRSSSEGRRAAREAGCYGLFSAGEGGRRGQGVLCPQHQLPCDL